MVGPGIDSTLVEKKLTIRAMREKHSSYTGDDTV